MQKKSDKKILAVIPARGGSKGILHKNIYPLCNKPLIEYTIEASINSGVFEDIVVSTDSKDIAVISKNAGAWVPFLRPAKLSEDDTKSVDVVLHTIEYLKSIGKSYDIIVLLQPTSPLRDALDIRNAVEYFLQNDIRSLASVSESVNPILIRSLTDDNQMHNLLNTGSSVRRQDMEKYYCINGAIYINYVEDVSEHTSFNDNETAFVMIHQHAVDIDDMQDMELAEFYLLKGK